MSGYLEAGVLHRAAPTGGWYETGDVGALDRDGFLVVVDRDARFAEIGGELVALARVEDALRSAAPGGGVRLAVVATRPADGGGLVVVHAPLPVELERLRRAALAEGLPAAAVPPPSAWVEVAELPLRRSGKLDLRALQELARAAAPARSR